MLNRINEFYKEAKEACKHFKADGHEAYITEDDFDMDESNLEYIGEVENQIHNKIQAMAFSDKNEYENLISLLIIYFYTIVAKGEYYENLENAEDEEEYEEIYDELIEMIITLDKDDIINSIENQENTYLYELIRFVIQREVQHYEYEGIEVEEDYDDIMYIRDTLKKEEGIRIYKKFHPNLEHDLKLFEYQLKKEENFKKLQEIKIKNLTDFFYAFNLVKNQLKTTTYIKLVLRNILYEIKDKNLMQKIKEILLSYYYVYQKNFNEEFYEESFFKIDVKNAFDDNMNFMLACDHVVKCFCNFNMNEYYNLLNNLSEEEKQKLSLTKKNR